MTAPNTPNLIGMYVDKMIVSSMANTGACGVGDVLPVNMGDFLFDLTAQDAFLQKCQDLNIRLLSLYDMHNVGEMVSSHDSETFDGTGRGGVLPKDAIKAFITNAKTNYSVAQVSIVCDLYRANSTNYDGNIQYKRVEDYNVTTSVSTLNFIDRSNTETEYWNFALGSTTYSTGTIESIGVSRTSRIVTITSGTFPTGIEREFIRVGGTNGPIRQVVERLSGTQIKVDRPFLVDYTGQAYIIAPSVGSTVDFLTYLHRIKKTQLMTRSGGGFGKLEAYYGFTNSKADNLAIPAHALRGAEEHLTKSDLWYLAPYLDYVLPHNYRENPSWSRIATRVTEMAEYRTGTIKTRFGDLFTLDGTGTSFLTELAEGTIISVAGYQREVNSILTDTELILSSPMPIAILSNIQYGVYTNVIPIISVESKYFYQPIYNKALAFSTYPSYHCTPGDPAETNFSGFVAEGRDLTTGAPGTYTPKHATWFYRQIALSGGAGSTPAQTGSPLSFNQDTTPHVIDNINLEGIIFFSQHLFFQLAMATGIIVTTNVVDASCTGFDGSISVSGVTGHSGSILGYKWYDQDGTLLSETGPVLFNVSPGSYTVIVTDSNGDQGIGIGIVGGGSSLVISAIQTAIDCYGEPYDITISASGGTGPYEYSLDGTTWQGSNVFSGVASVPQTFFIIYVRDAVGCVKSRGYDLVFPIAVAFTAVDTDATCSGAGGTISINASGGDGTYEYSIDNGGSWQDAAYFSGLGVAEGFYNNLPGGDYDVLVRDGNGCEATLQVVTVSVIGSLNPTISDNGIFCSSGGGLLTANVTTGVAPYSYLWSSGETTQSISPGVVVGAGTRSVVVTDSNGCTGNATINYEVTLDPDIDPIIVPTGNLSYCKDISVFLTVSNAGSFDSLLWNTGQTTATIAVGVAGTYTVQGFVGGCPSEVISVVVAAPVEMVLSAVSTKVLCNGNSDGSIVLSVVGGRTPYSYNWKKGATQIATTQNISSLDAGTYTVTVIDADGCIKTLSVDVLQLSVLNPNLVVTQPSCSGVTGEATVAPSGGSGSYLVLWSTGETSNTISNLISGGAYSVRVTDLNGCFAYQEFEINAIVPGALNLLGRCPSSENSEDGWIQARMSGGSGIFSYVWKKNTVIIAGETSDVLTGVGVGTYEAIVTDINTCVYQRTRICEVNDPIEITDDEARLHNLRCCAGDYAVKASVASNNGTSNAKCLESKSETLTNLTWVLENNPEDCLTQDEINYIWDLTKQYCSCKDC